MLRFILIYVFLKDFRITFAHVLSSLVLKVDYSRSILACKRFFKFFVRIS